MSRKIMITLLALSLLAITAPALALPGGSYIQSCRRNASWREPCWSVRAKRAPDK